MDERIIPHVGWVNVLPAADASVDITVLGQELKFEGNGYHDKVGSIYISLLKFLAQDIGIRKLTSLE